MHAHNAYLVLLSSSRSVHGLGQQEEDKEREGGRERTGKEGEGVSIVSISSSKDSRTSTQSSSVLPTIPTTQEGGYDIESDWEGEKEGERRRKDREEVNIVSASTSKDTQSSLQVLPTNPTTLEDNGDMEISNDQNKEGERRRKEGKGVNVTSASTSTDTQSSLQILLTNPTTLEGDGDMESCQEGEGEGERKQKEGEGKKHYFTRSTGAAPPFAKKICKGHQLY